MKQFIILLFMLFASVSYSQNAKLDSKGNYVAVKSAKITSDTITGKTFTDTKGVSYPVFKSKNDKLYIWRTSKKGNKYKQYLKLS